MRNFVKWALSPNPIDMISYNTLRNWSFGVITHQYDQNDVIKYALGCGMGADPTDLKQLLFVFEKGLKVIPSMAAIIGSPGSWWRIPDTQVTWQKVLHAQQDVVFHQAMPITGNMHAYNRVTHLHDRGNNKGAIAGLTREIYDNDKKLIATASRIEVLRADGGFSKFNGIHDSPPTRLQAIPTLDKSPSIVDLPILPQGALLYRLNGDPNPLHADPTVAKNAGFTRPIFHGLGSFGYAAHAILKSCCNFEPTALKRLAVRFTSPVYPGETLRFSIWRRNANLVNFQAHSKEREILVLDCGLAELA